MKTITYVAAIEAKRKWMRGEISDDEMYAALDAVRAAAWAAARAAAWAAAWAAERCAWRSVATFAEKSEEMREEQLAEREWRIAELMRMLEAQE